MDKQKNPHVKPRDGSQGLGYAGRPQPVPRPSKSHEARNEYFKGSVDPRWVEGSFSPADTAAGVHVNRSADCGRAGWEALPGGEPSPRQRAQRGEKVVEPSKSDGLSPTILS